MDTTDRTVDLEIVEDVAHVRLNRPERLNAVSAQLVRDLVTVLTQAIDESPRAMVLAGNGRAFCAGQDLKEIQPPSTDPDARRRLLTEAEEITRLVRRAPFPVIAAVHGYAMGAGCEIALMCDLVVADQTAVFAFPEVAVAQAVGQGISHRLPLTVGPARAKELLLFGARFDAVRGHDLGLVNEVTAPGGHVTRATELATDIVALSPLAVRLAKNAIDAGADGTLDDALALETQHLMRVDEDPAMQSAAQRFTSKDRTR
ncbi:enoyl-CoA hydratase/isomerase family protein [Nocardioides daeguensis]|uniref:Enoyl-CoA hydratase/isomerase family protein n=1 Tax=Nocardioides daeguensis TaxID=908359 RepID=A0ABP6W5R4_9ACTN|nr:enoyl-CoA hydratase/isomerase family protein [Nocardioides daeguensis]MBV6729804.1 enoyl-CoA hydratase/isomerase family protein [Nocardioides daeguensis]MCR1775375.1 enoyl-CoA hydratase/isomerase family protein [Nocardioides daeguensis]